MVVKKPIGKMTVEELVDWCVKTRNINDSNCPSCNYVGDMCSFISRVEDCLEDEIEVEV